MSMGLRRRLRKLEHRDLVAIPQRDGSIRTFTDADLRDAYLNIMERARLGTLAGPPEHPLVEAARNSSDPDWADSYFSGDEAGPYPPPDLSEL